MSPRDVLAGELRQALENWFGETLGKPWDDVIETLALVVDEGQLDLDVAARLDRLLRSTTGAHVSEDCTTCHCPMPGIRHV